MQEKFFYLYFDYLIKKCINNQHFLIWMQLEWFLKKNVDELISK